MRGRLFDVGSVPRRRSVTCCVEFPPHAQARPDRRRRSRPASHPRRNHPPSRLRDPHRPRRRAGAADPRGARSRRDRAGPARPRHARSRRHGGAAAPRAQARHPADHHADGARLHRRRHHRHARRRRRLRGQADLARAARGVDQQRAQDRGAAGRDRPHQEEGRGHAGLRRPDRARPGHAARRVARATAPPAPPSPC